MMSATDRVRQQILFTSVSGKTFEALYTGSPRSGTKSLAIFKYPNIKGEVVQDLEIGSDRYPMTIFFEGPDHDFAAQDFHDELRLKGQWDVVHPIHGNLALQLIDCAENDDPIQDSNRTSFDLNWIEPANIQITLSEEELVAQINAQAKKTNESFLDQLKKLKQDTFAKIQAAKDAIDSVTNAINSVLGPIAATITELNDAFNQITASIQNLLDSGILDPAALLGQITNLTQLPLLANNDFQSRMDSYTELSENTFELSPSDATDASFNTTLIQELALGSVLVASAQITATSDFTTRAQVIDAIERTNNLLKDTTDRLDLTQKLFDGNDVDNQYFSNSSSFTDIYLLTSMALRLLILSIFDLKIEKRFKLKKNRAVIEIVITEYGDVGDDDIFYNLFITSNKLKGNDILILPAGREVVVYV